MAKLELVTPPITLAHDHTQEMVKRYELTINLQRIKLDSTFLLNYVQDCPGLVAYCFESSPSDMS